MPRKKETKRRQPRIFAVATNCPFCKGKADPDYKNLNDLGKYITDRGKIIPKMRSGLCAKHQRRLSVAIKRARFLALLPYTGSL